MKRIISLLLAAVMLLAIIPFSASNVNAAISTSTFNTKVQEFINDSRWKNGITWKEGQKPKLSTYSSIECCAYAADFCAYVYGSKSKAWNTSDFTKFTNVNEIRAGDIIHTSNHWFVVISRTGDNFYTCEGNFDDKVRVTKSGWGIRNGKIYNLKATNGARTFAYGFHYKFSNQEYPLSYNANGGSGSISSTTTTTGGSFTIPTSGFAREGYKLNGFTVKRSDNTWYVAGQGWLSESDITSNNYEKKIYTLGTTYVVDNSWSSGLSTQFSYVFYASWVPSEYTVQTYENHSQTNYMLDGGFVNDFNTEFIYSRDTSVSTISRDTSVKRVSDYNTLKIVNTAVGSSGKDLAIVTSTNGNNNDNCYNGDEKSMTLSFWAKSSKAGTKMYLRWGYEVEYRNITLSTDWAYYTVPMNKTASMGQYIHPYADSIGTVWISEMQLNDGTSATDFVNETGGTTVVTATYGRTYSNLPTPTRDGYIFDGWYTSKSGGEKIDTDTSVLPYNICIYAHWTEDVASDDTSSDDTSSDDTSSDDTSSDDTSSDDTSSDDTSSDDTSSDDTSSDDTSSDDEDNNQNPEPPIGGETESKLGDINSNGMVDMIDYILLKRAFFGTYDLNEEQEKRGDCNQNGKIDMTDYILLKRAYFGTYVLEKK